MIEFGKTARGLGLIDLLLWNAFYEVSTPYGRSERRTADRRWSGAQPLPRRHLFHLHKRFCIGQPFVTPKALLASHLRRTTE
jgi:hypothetical protein